jgi:hypothetical protein
MESNAELSADRFGDGKVFRCSTVGRVIVFFPVFHEKSSDL